MCIMKSPSVSAAPAIIAGTNNAEANAAADVEARLRRQRAGAAANVLTSPTGIPATSQLGSPA